MNNIEIIEKYIKEVWTPKPIHNVIPDWATIEKREIQAIKTLIEENKDLKNKCNELNFKYTAQWVDDNFIPKSKVKELLEHYKNTGYNELEEVLQELLEGDENNGSN